jgi:hypothetical protein
MLLGLAVVIDVMLVLGLGLLPVDAAGGLHCDAPLRHATARPNGRTSGLVVGNAQAFCSDAANSRWATVAVVALVVLVLAAAAVLLPADRFENVVLGREANPLKAVPMWRPAGPDAPPDEDDR